MYDPFAQPHPIDPGMMQTMTAPAPTAAPGVMPLSPNNALATMGRGMRPGGGGGMPGGAMRDPGVQAVWAQRPDHHAYQFDMRQAPDDAARRQIEQGFWDQMDQWRTSLSGARQQYHMQQAPNWRPNNIITPMPPSQLPVDPPMMSPGGGETGAPPQGPNTQFPLNPGASGPPSNDWRHMRAPKPNYGA